MAGTIVWSRFGEKLQTAGDVNGDGYADVVVSAFYGGPGAAYVFLGGAGTAFDATAGMALAGAAAMDGFGIAVE